MFKNLLKNAKERYRRSTARDLANTSSLDLHLKRTVACVVGVLIDAIFLYIPFLSHTNKCLGMNKTLWKVAVAFRCVVDCVYLSTNFYLNKVSPSLLFKTSLAVVPIPQILFAENFIFKISRIWNVILVCQYEFRLVLITSSWEQFRTKIPIATQIQLKFVAYLYHYLIVGHVIGACWYYLSIERQVSCWKHACKFDTGCVHNIFHCDGTTTSPLNSTLVNEFCPLNPQKFGIYLDALQSGIVEDKGLAKKLLLSFFWGLRNLSSFASNLQTSTNVVEILFAIIVSVLGVIMLVYSIGFQVSVPKKLNIQEKAEKWLSDNNIPHDQNNILSNLTSGLKKDEDVNLKSVLSVLPDESKWMIMKDLCFDTLKKVPRLHNIDEEWFKSISSKLKPVVYPEESYIFREGKSLDFIIFITNGIAWSYTTSTGASGRVSVSINSLEKGDFFGEELVRWKLDKISELESDTIPLSCIPISTVDVKSHTQVEAFVLMINDLALSSDFPVDRSRSANSATEGVASSSRTVEGGSVQSGEIVEVIC